MSGYSLKLDSRKSSWSNFLIGRDQSGTDQSKRLHTQGSRPYNIDDYLPPRTIVGTYASVDHDIDEEYGPPLVMTARFAEVDKQTERRKEESHILQQWKQQQVEMQKLKLAVQALQEKKKRKILGFGDRFEWKVHPQRKLLQQRSTQTEVQSKENEPNQCPAPVNLVPPINSIVSSNLANLPTTPISNGVSHKTRRPSDDMPYRPPLSLLTDRQTNMQLLTGRETVREPLKRVRKEYTELYPVNVSEINDIVIGLLRCTVGDGL